ncbi:polysaccharide pyruvyl transferase family protein [Candidatus Thorarchaeota archaeon]|nr:MAG: polysaccharide pyruvyl transferase family protein [Candidatus Thorarchaeota archaeon]
MNRTFTLVSGALKNVGDFLISEKCKEMVETYLKPTDSLILKRDADFESYLRNINNTDAIIICGGPGYNIDFYGQIYPFLRLYNRIRIPIIPFGLGWRGFPLYHAERFKFSEKSKIMIRHIHERIANSSVRDELTKFILQHNGVKNVINTGCPTLFDLTKMKNDTQFSTPSEINKIAVSMAQQPILHTQNIQLLQRLRDEFPNSDIIAVFHRGTEADKYTIPKEGEILQKLVANVKNHGFKIIDLAYDLNRIKIYSEADFHIGYRVHAHAYSVSQRIPTFLLWEDGRGQGMSQNLRLPGIPARRTSLVDTFPGSSTIKNYLEKCERKLVGAPGPNTEAIDQIMQLIQHQIETKFDMFKNTPKRLSELFSNLKAFFQSNENMLYQ